MPEQVSPFFLFSLTAHLTLDIDTVCVRHPALLLRRLVLHHEGVLWLVKEHGQGVVDRVAVRKVVRKKRGAEVHDLDVL